MPPAAQAAGNDSALARTDHYGDPLPAGALARMGTMRLRHVHFSPFSTAFSRDGRLLASGGMSEIRLWDLATGRLLRELCDGKRSMYCILVFAPDGRWFAGAGMHATCIWDTATGQQLHEFPANGQAVACSPDGKLLAASSKDGSASVWDTTTGRQVAHLREGSAKEVHRPTFTTDGKGLVTQLGNRFYHWDLVTGKVRKAVEIPVPPGAGVLPSPDGQTLAVIPTVTPQGRSEPISLRDSATGKERLKLQGALAVEGFGIAFSADGQTLATNCNNPYAESATDDDGTTVALWNAKTGELCRQLHLPTRNVNSLQFSPDGRTLLTTGYEPVIRLWDAATGQPLHQWPAHLEGVQALAFTPDGQSLVSGSTDRTVRLWEVASGRQVRELSSHRWRCDVVAVTPDGRAVVSGGADGCIRVQDYSGNELRRILLDGPPEQRDKPVHHVVALGVTPDGKSAATWSYSPNGGHRVYHVWDLATGEASVNRTDTGPVVDYPLFSPDGRLALTNVYEKPAAGPAPAAGAGGRVPRGGPPPGMPILVGVRLCEVATSREVLRLRYPEEISGPRAFTPDGRMLVVVTRREERTGDSFRYQDTVHVWELATGKERRTFSFGPSSVHWFQHVACAADGRTLAAAHNNGTIQLWDLNTGRERHFRAEATTEVNSLTFSSDGRLLATGHRDGTIFVWDAAAAVGRPRRNGQPDAAQLEQWWADLAGEDARRAYAAVCELAVAAPHAVCLFRDRLCATSEGPPDRLRQLIADLDSPEFPRREAAAKQLTAFHDQAEPALRAALQAGPSAEQRRRIEAILDSFTAAPSGEALRHLRAVEVLERIGTPESRQVLQRLAGGLPTARLTREAKAVIDRLDHSVKP
jgi:WD40 repeat protein